MDPGHYYSGQWSSEDTTIPFDGTLSAPQYHFISDFSRKQMTEMNIASAEHSFSSYGRSYSLQIPHTDATMYDPRSTWPFTGDGYRPPRYASPNGHLGGTMSEASSSGDFDLSPEMSAYSLPFSNSATNLSQQYYFPAIDPPVTDHMPWQPEAPRSYTPPGPYFLHTSQSSVYPMKELEFVLPQELRLEDPLYEDLEPIAIKKPGHIYEPEELELSASSTSNTDSGLTAYHPSSSSTRSVDIDDEDDMKEEDSIVPDNDSDSDYKTSSKRKVRSRNGLSTSGRGLRSPRRVSHQVVASNSKVRKSAPGHARRTFKSNRRSSLPTGRGSSTNKADRLFPCTFHSFGCDATFGNKNEWKRHVASQHLQLGYYRCDLGGCTQGASKSNKDVIVYNDFNRKDLFTQHCRRMHGPARMFRVTKPTKEEELIFETELEKIRERCWQIRRKAPARSSCGFCSRLFETAEEGGESRAWEERMEHVGRHYEKDNINIRDERVDEDLVEWGLQTGVFHLTPDGQPWLTNCPYSQLAKDGRENKQNAREKIGRHSARSARRYNVQKMEDSEEDAYGEDE